MTRIVRLMVPALAALTAGTDAGGSRRRSPKGASPKSKVIVFNGQGNNLDAYAPTRRSSTRR